MSLSKFWKEAVAYRLGGGHAADHAALGGIPTFQIGSDGGVIGLFNKSTGIPITYPGIRWSKLPTPGTYGGLIVRVSDFGQPYSVWYSDGTYWLPIAGQMTISQQHFTNIGMTGSACAGTSDIGSGLSGTHPRFKLGSPIDIPSSIIGPNGTIRVRAKFGATNNANLKEVGLAFGKKYITTIVLATNTSASWGNQELVVEIQARGNLTSQLITSTFTQGSTVTQSSTTTSINMALSQQLFAFGVLTSGTASDEIFLNSIIVELIRGAA